jgi:tetratricopeptide (TPR) repeat protein
MFLKMLNVAYRLAPGVMLVGALLLATPLPASARDQKTDYYASMIEKKIHVLLKKADALLKANHLDEARKVLQQAGALKEKLLSLLKGQKKAKKKVSDKNAHYKKILDGLKGGIGALKALGCKDEARRLEQIAKDLARRLKGKDKRRPATDQQRGMAQRQLKILRMAKHALLEGDRKDLAEQIELTIHAIELALEGRRDEAMKIPQSALKRESVARILFYASRLWRTGKKKSPDTTGTGRTEKTGTGKTIRLSDGFDASKTRSGSFQNWSGSFSRSSSAGIRKSGRPRRKDAT